ncbi:hypothetical protein GOP47_0023806 [Adiantum capillus-veneris]|uniref:Uncharacterized protein n=1 Tax=Adiantum capillus-veneris TaxID=13818 RepID=A0A9D4Z4T5_ADICA|nr:hypothetical protein GOP47_0023804 [Adiantum capillus-veneris]KAI5061301.1 hypothetical protein GOP47_0023806 [Adiantum capillus-veneris]
MEAGTNGDHHYGSSRSAMQGKVGIISHQRVERCSVKNWSRKTRQETGARGQNNGYISVGGMGTFSGTEA